MTYKHQDFISIDLCMMVLNKTFFNWSMYDGAQQDFISIDLYMMVLNKTLFLLIYVWWCSTRFYFYWSMYDGDQQDFISIDLCMMVPNKTLFLLIYVWWCSTRLYFYWSIYGGAQQDFISIDLCMMVLNKTLFLLIYVWWCSTRLDCMNNFLIRSRNRLPFASTWVHPQIVCWCLYCSSFTSVLYYLRIVCIFIVLLACKSVDRSTFCMKRANASCKKCASVHAFIRQ
jgi:hypothetical protein